jgi:hypothetical protein
MAWTQKQNVQDVRLNRENGAAKESFTIRRARSWSGESVVRHTSRTTHHASFDV